MDREVCSVSAHFAVLGDTAKCARTLQTHWRAHLQAHLQAHWRAQLRAQRYAGRMSITFTRIDPAGADRAELIEFMTSNHFPFHVRPSVDARQVEESIAEGAYRSDDNDSYWIEHAAHGRIGFLRFEDLEDPTPLFDLRLDSSARGQGLAAEVLRAATDRVFTTMPQAHRRGPNA